MEIFYSDELRLAYALLTQAAILLGAARFVRRRLNADLADRLADVLLLTFLVEYLAVTLPGLCGLLSAPAIVVTSLACAAALYFAPHRAPPTISTTPTTPVVDRWALLLCGLFALGYAGGVCVNQRLMPVVANDAITYHFPAAAQWLRTGRLTLFETWYFNPANTYSPLAGSTFIAWWMAPLKSDVLARHVQFPALLLIYFASIRIFRALGARPALAGLIALALFVSRPFLRQVVIEKDDLYLAAFFACAAVAVTGDRLRDPVLGPLRLGAALGLMLATKYTALLTLPLFLLALPIRPLRRALVAVAIAALLAGPWYLRNWIEFGNPLYPVRLLHLPGLFATARSRQFASVASVWSLLTTRDQSLPLIPMLLLILGWAAAVALRWRDFRFNPVVRLCLLGPPLALVIFLTTSPYAEVRFLYPAFILLFATAALAVARVRATSVQLVAAAALLAACFFTCFSPAAFAELVSSLLGAAAVVLFVGVVIRGCLDLFPNRARATVATASSVGVLVLVGLVYVQWPAFINDCRGLAATAYASQYDDTARVWEFVRDKLPPTEPLAYANTFLVHPLAGFDDARPLIYVPTRRNVAHLSDLPPFGERLSGERINPAMAAALSADTDATGWLKRLAASGATHLIVFKHDVAPNPPELAIVRDHAAMFEPVFENETAVVYRLKNT